MQKNELPLSERKKKQISVKGKKQKAEKKEPGSFEGGGQKWYDILFDPSKKLRSIQKFIPSLLQREYYAVLWVSVSVFVDINEQELFLLHLHPTQGC